MAKSLDSLRLDYQLKKIVTKLSFWLALFQIWFIFADCEKQL